MYSNLYETLKNLAIFIENEYFSKYIQLVELNRLTKQQSFITQKHHIIPQYYFKKNNLPIDNSKNNIINLQYKDHILAHYYLINCCKNDSDILSNIHAFNILLRKQGHKLSKADLNNFLTTAEQFEQKRLLHLSGISKLKNTGGKYVNKNGIVKHIKLSEVDLYLADGWQLGNPKAAHKDKSKKYCVTNEIVFKRVAEDEIAGYLATGWRLGAPKSTSETKQKIAIATKGHRCNTRNKIVVTKNGKNIFICKADLDNYLADGWQIGSKPRTTEFKQLISKQKTGLIWINNGQVSKMISKDNLEHFLKEGYVQGRIPWKKKIK